MNSSAFEVREEFGFADWLESIGPVKWIVLGRNAEPNTEFCRKKCWFFYLPYSMRPDRLVIGLFHWLALPNDQWQLSTCEGGVARY